MGKGADERTGKGGSPLPGGNQVNNQQGQQTTSKAPGPTQSATSQSSSQHSAANADNQGSWYVLFPLYVTALSNIPLPDLNLIAHGLLSWLTHLSIGSQPTGAGS